MSYRPAFLLSAIKVRFWTLVFLAARNLATKAREACQSELARWEARL